MIPALDIDAYGLAPPAEVHRFESELAEYERDQAAEGRFDLDRWVADSRNGVEAMLRDAEAGKLADLNAAIKKLESYEEAVRPHYLMVRDQLEGLIAAKRQAMSLPPVTRGEMLSRLEGLRYRGDRMLAAAESVLRLYRDSRWELMAMEAESRPESDTPIFDDADALVTFLKS